MIKHIIIKNNTRFK